MRLFTTPFVKCFVSLLFLMQILVIEGQSNLVFEDDFDGTSLDLTKWNVINQCNQIYGQEQECYVNDASVVYVEDGFLFINPRPARTCVNGHCNPAASGKITTLGKYGFNKGYYEMRAKLPTGKYLWPAFWAIIPTAAGAYGELDVMEGKGTYPNYTSSTMWASNGTVINGVAVPPTKVNSWSSFNTRSGNLEKDFHIFAMNWTSTTVTFSVDGVKTLVSNFDKAPSFIKDGTNVFNSTDYFYYLILNVAVGGNMFGTLSNTTNVTADGANWSPYIVDYVRVYSVDGMLETVPTTTVPVSSTTTSKAASATSPSKSVTMTTNNMMSATTPATSTIGVSSTSVSTTTGITGIF